MPLIHWFRPPRYLLTLYLAGAVTGVVCLAWLAGRLLAQEQAVESERARAQLEVAADRAVAVFQRSLNELERQALSEDGPLPPDTVAVIADHVSIRSRPAGRLIFVPVVPPSSEVPPGVFTAGERAEFGKAGLASAIDIYRALTRARSRAVRAGAFVRLGRTLRKAGRHTEALQAYAELARVEDVRIDGRPADLIAREARCSVLDETGQRALLEREANDLRRDLASGHWALTRAAWEFVFSEASTWAGPGATTINGLDAAIALAVATDALWQQWQDRPTAGQAVIRHADRPVLAMWKTAPPQISAVLGGREYLETICRQVSIDANAQVALADRDGQPILGRVSGTQATRATADTGLPWTIAVAASHPNRAVAEALARRRLLLTGLAIVGVLILGSSYFTFRGIQRELAIARLQSEFVSAVSHEFRTPLTSMRQLSHMLLEGRVISNDRRGQYYEVLVRESERLHRLVEKLLSFGRAESGAGRYRFESLDAGDLVRAVTTEFRSYASDWSLEISTPSTPCPVRADREMLSLALWNLLDNAMKYSPESRMIWVDLSIDAKHASIAVRDRGIGIPRQDRQRIFRKFERGAQAAESGVQGTGIGLALVHHVVHAHRGEVRLESEVGRGSTFTMVIPVETTA
ncbi:MAG: HAMP domain-containing sensor histidine kinase [Acidobacteria bacterium]|nr:HAMP domain-containing sensor histidine kinase [Acidobacteriota bacterium]